MNDHMVHEHMVNGVHLITHHSKKNNDSILELEHSYCTTVPVVPGSVVVEAGTRYLYNVYLCIF